MSDPSGIVIPVGSILRNVDELVPYEKNPRTHSEAQISKLAASIREFGFTNPILIDGDRGIIAGHGRLVAARSLGMKKVPVVELSHLTPAQKKAYIIADNRLALEAGWDEVLLREEIQELREEGYDLALTGFNDPEIAGILLDKSYTPTDPHKEWTGMPEYQQEEQKEYHHVTMHFPSEHDMKSFARLIGQTVSEHTHHLWHPRVRETADSPRYE